MPFAFMFSTICSTFSPPSGTPKSLGQGSFISHFRRLSKNFSTHCLGFNLLTVDCAMRDCNFAGQMQDIELLQLHLPGAACLILETFAEIVIEREQSIYFSLILVPKS
jgi:hypothetical protein